MVDDSHMKTDESPSVSQVIKSVQPSSSSNPEGVRTSLHGTIYQLKLSMLFLQNALNKRYTFELYSEKNDAKKFDDVIFKYNKKDKYRFLQAKHKLEPNKDRITMDKLCSDDFKEPFSMQQYFIAFRKITSNNKYEGKIEDFIICTNTDFIDTIKNSGSITQRVNNDDLLNIGGGECYKFVFSKDSQLVKKLKDASDVKRLAKELYKVINDQNKPINLKQDLFKAYHIPLTKEVFKKYDKEGRYVVQENFINESGISDKAKLLRNALEKEAVNASSFKKQTKNTKHELRNVFGYKEEENRIISDFWKKVKTKKLEVSSSFGRHPKLSSEKLTHASNDDLTELDELLTESLNNFLNNPTLSDKFIKLYHKYYDALVKEDIIDLKGRVNNAGSSEIAKKFLKLEEFKKSKTYTTKCNRLCKLTDEYIRMQNSFAKRVAQDFKELIEEANADNIDLKLNKSRFSKYTDKKDFIKEKLPGYILVKSEEKNLVRFNLNFPEKNLPEDVKTFKTELRNLLQNAGVSELQRFKFKISSEMVDLFPEEEELYSKVFLPDDIVEDNEIQHFFEKLVLAVNQPNEQKLRELIEEKIFNDLDHLTDKDQVDIVYNFVQSQMLEWLKRPESIALTEKDNFFEQGKKRVWDIMSSLSRTEYTRHFDKLGVKFVDDKLAEIKFFLLPEDRKKILIMATTYKNLLLTQAKVNQVKPEIQWPLETLLLAKKHDIKQNFYQNDTLVIVCDNKTLSDEAKYVPSFINELNKFLEGFNKKLILITCTDNDIACSNKNFVNNFLEGQNFEYKRIEDETTLNILSKNFLQTRLLRKEIKFQGQDTYFASILNIDEETLQNVIPDDLLQRLEEVMGPKAISEIILSENLSVGDILPNFGDENSRYYDPFHIDLQRKLDVQVIKKKALKSLFTKIGVFAFSNVSIDELKNYILKKNKNYLRTFDNNDKCSDSFFDGKYFILNRENPNNDFKELCKRHTENVSWFEFTDGNFKVMFSDALPTLRKFVKVLSINDIEAINDPALIMAGDPGIGKSTVLTDYSQKLSSSSWIIRINLKEHDDYLERNRFDENEERIMSFFLQNITKKQDTFIANSILKYRLKYQGQIMFLLDGYDEISEKSQENVVALIKYLLKTKGRVWITTRTNEQQNLENALGIYSHNLRRFDNKEQIVFLKQFWCIALNSESSLIEDFAKKLTKHFYTKRFRRIINQHLIGIALQTRMLAEMFKKDCQTYIDTENFDVNEFQFKNIYDLYTSFIQLQYKQHFGKKENKKLSKNELGILCKAYTKEYGYIAMKTLFHTNEICKQLLELRKPALEHDDLNKPCIIRRVEESGIAEFVHQTYAEYFFAKYLIYALKKSEDRKIFKLVHEFLLKNIFFERNKLIRTFVEHEIQTAGNTDLKSKWESVIERDLFRKSKSRKCNGLPFFVLRSSNVLLNNNSENSCFDIDKCALSELQQIVKKYMRESDELDSSEVFIDKMNRLQGSYCSRSIFNNLRYLIKSRMFETDFCNRDKLEFLKLFKKCSSYGMTEGEGVLTFDEATNILKMMERLLNENNETVGVLSIVVDYFYIFAKAGLQIIDLGEKLLVIDKITEFQLELTIPCKKQLVELITPKRKSRDRITAGGKIPRRCY